MKKLLFTILILSMLASCSSAIDKPRDGAGTYKDDIPNGPLQGFISPIEKMNWTGFFLCLVAYIFAVFSIWAVVHVGSRYDDEMEEAFLRRMIDKEWIIPSTPPNNQENQ